MARPHTNAWRERWLGVAEAFRTTEKDAHAEDAKLIEKILAEQAEAAERDLEDNRRAMQERVGTISAVAEETGYTPRHLYTLIEQGKLTPRNPGDGPTKVRYADVWALRGVPLHLVDEAHEARAGQAARSQTPPPLSRERVVVRVVQ